MKMTITFILIIGFLPTFAQKLVSFKDHDLTVSLEIPKKWKELDDGYNYLIIPSSSNGELISITYVESDNNDLNEYVQFRLQYFYPLNVNSFKKLDMGDDEIGGLKAKWINYESKENSQEYVTLVYNFIEHGQVFLASARSRKENVEKNKDEFIKIIKSIRIHRN